MMLNNAYKIEIPEKCDKNWNELDGSGDKKDCSICSKPVYNFSGKTDKEIFEFIKSRKGQRICGMFSSSQLNRQLRVTSRYLKPFSFILPSIFILNLSDVYANTTVKDSIQITQSIINSDSVTLTGIVIDSTTKEPLIFANILIKGTKIGISTDMNGKFNFTFDSQLLINHDSLEIHYVGYKNKSVKIDPENTSNITIELNGETEFMGEVVFVREPLRKRLFKRRNKEAKND